MLTVLFSTSERPWLLVPWPKTSAECEASAPNLLYVMLCCLKQNLSQNNFLSSLDLYPLISSQRVTYHSIRNRSKSQNRECHMYLYLWGTMVLLSHGSCERFYNRYQKVSRVWSKTSASFMQRMFTILQKLSLYFPFSVSFDKFQSSVLLVKTKIQLQNRLNKSLANLWPAWWQRKPRTLRSSGCHQERAQGGSALSGHSCPITM